MNIIQKYITNNDCYKANVNRADSRYRTFQDKGPQGLMLHSVGCAQPSALVFANLWNKGNYQVAVHAALQADGTVYQCLPWNFRGWHAGSTANNTHVGVEMTEPACLKYGNGGKFTCSDLPGAQNFVRQTYAEAVHLFAKLCYDYNLDPLKPGVIISHKEGHKLGVASNHGDPEHLWSGLGLSFTMDTFRAAVKAELDQLNASEPAPQPAPDTGSNPPAEDGGSTASGSDLPAEPETPQPKLDNTPASWSKDAVEWATKNKLLVGDTTGDLMLRQPITREQLCVILKRYDELRG